MQGCYIPCGGFILSTMKLSFLKSFGRIVRGEEMAKPLVKQVEQYCSWKSIRHPDIARRHKRVLSEFFEHTAVPCATLITGDQVREFSNRYPAQFQRKFAYHVLRQFMRYWYRMGVLTQEFASIVRPDIIYEMETPHPLMHVDQVRRVKKLRAEGMSFSKIKLLMETEDGRKYDIHSIHRWSKYQVPELSPEPSKTI